MSNTLNLVLSYDYVKSLLNLNWRDVLYAIDHGFFSTQAAIDYAVELIGKEQEPSQSVIALACLDKGESIHPHIDELASQPSEHEDSISQKKFLYAILNWVYEHREQYEDPLEMVEIIYADFDYPEEIAGFVRYMPVSDPVLGSLELNRERLFNKWKDYLEKQKSRYSM